MKLPGQESFIGNFNDPHFGERVRQEVYQGGGLAIFEGMHDPQQLLDLSEILGGEVRKFRLTDESGIGELVDDPNEASAPGAIDTELNVHTDGTRVENPAHLLVLYCKNPADDGGESFYLKGADMYRYLQENNSPLFEAFHQRWLFGREDDGHEAPVFETKDGLTTVRFRRDPYDNFSDLRPEIDTALKEMSANGLIRQIKLPLGWGVAVNNYSVLHGRTAIEGNTIRRVVRANVDVTSPELRSYLGFRV